MDRKRETLELDLILFLNLSNTFLFCKREEGCLRRRASITAGPVPGDLVSEVPTCSSGPSLPNVLEAPVSADSPQVQSTVRAASRRALLLFMAQSGGDS